MPVAIADIDGVNTPTLIGATGVTGHPPAKPAERLNRRQVHYGRDEALGIATPCLKACNWTAPIRTDRAVIAAHEETFGRDVLKCISAVAAELQHATVEAEIRIRIRGFEIEVMPEY